MKLHPFLVFIGRLISLGLVGYNSTAIMERTAEDILRDIESLEDDLQVLSDDNDRKFQNILSSIDNFTDNVNMIEAEFDNLTQLKKEDYPFIILCAGLQAVRQYFITGFEERLEDDKAAKEVKGGKKEHSNRNKTRYYCSTKNIITNPVPFDAMEHNEKVSPGLSGFNHRTKCLGHYPELGYVFGTVNIMTSTVTTKEGLVGIKTYHVKTEALTYVRKGETENRTVIKDYIYSEAHTSKMFEHCIKRIKDNPKEGIPALIAAIAKEHEHLRSDERSKKSLPFPFLSFTPGISEHLGEYGLDYINFKTVAKQAAYSYFVNLIVQILYYAYHIGKQIPKAHSKSDIKIDDIVKVRLQKIINVANVISTSTNLTAVIVGIFTGNMDLVRKFDVGGCFTTFHALSKSADFMIQVKQAYIKNELSKINSKI